MSKSRDLFSSQADVYAAFRPTYPPPLYQFIFDQVTNFGRAWDCATGNGQVATYLARHFREVIATDLSQAQLDQAAVLPNIHYCCEPAEEASISDRSIDLITVAQAIHWIDFNRFYSEVVRVSRPGALVAVWCYNLPSISKEADELLDDFYHHTTGPYWNPARRLVDERYKTIPFPFEEFPTPSFENVVTWNLNQLAGYLSSWSATQAYIRATGRDPVQDFVSKLEGVLERNKRFKATFSLSLRLGRVN